MTIEQDEVLPPIEISANIGGVWIKRNLSDDLKVDEEHINSYLQRAPGLTAYWNTLYEKQRSVVGRLKVSLDRKKAELDKNYRKQKRQDGERAPAAEIESEVITNAEYIAIEDDYLNNRETELLLKGAVEAIRELRSTLISLSANLRQSGDIKIKSVEENYRKNFLKKIQS